MPEFIDMIPKKNGKQLFSEWVAVQEEMSVNAYFQIPIIESAVEHIKNTIIADPEWAERTHVECEEASRRYFVRAEEIRAIDLSLLDDHALADLYLELHALQKNCHILAIATTWFVDSDGEVFSKHLDTALREWLASKNVTDVAEIMDMFILLTTPARDSMGAEEERAFLLLTKSVQSDDNARTLCTDDVSHHECLSQLPVDIQNQIHAHCEQWCWLPYGYSGPAYTEEDYVARLRDNVRSGIDVHRTLADMQNHVQTIHTQQESILQTYDIPAPLARLFSIAQEIIWLKDYRKLCLYHGCFVLDMVTKEIAKRLHLTLKQASHFLDTEIVDAVVHQDYDEHLLNERQKRCVVVSTPHATQYLYGKEAEAYIHVMDVEEIEVDPTQGFHGTCACPGTAEGDVKIINTVDDMVKMKDGDIMLAHTTFPALVPAMKKASAIITEDGGITCHAAIVARELRIPCVVGVKKITEFLDDGDRVSVDATRGTISRL